MAVNTTKSQFIMVLEMLVTVFTYSALLGMPLMVVEGLGGEGRSEVSGNQLDGNVLLFL
jgi:hypothetical protein